MTHRLLRSVTAGVALTAVVFGVPILLLRLGRSPLDGVGSTWDQLSSVLTNAISDTVAFGALTIVAWVVWAMFVLNVGIELGAAFGRGTRWRVPASAPLQMSARRLVMALTMTATLSGPLSQRSGAVPQLPAATATTVAPDTPMPLTLMSVGGTAVETQGRTGAAPYDVSLTAGPVPATTSSDQAQAENALPIVMVVPGDSPWLLAERHLGNGFRWREIWENNRGVTQPDGRAWVTEDLIHPGWQLCLPTDATGLQPAPAPEPEPAPSPQPPPPAPEPPAPTYHETPSAPITTPTTQDSQSKETDGQSEFDQDEDADDDTSVPALRLLGIAGTLLAVAMLREIRRRRTRRAAQLPVDTVPLPPPRVPVARELLEAADETEANRLDTALASLATSMRPRSGQPCPQPRVVQLRDDRIDIMLDRPDPSPPRPWRPEASGLIWVLDGPQQAPSPDAPLLAPALATIGIGEAPVLVDLEAYGVVALVGGHDICTDLARAVVAELSARAEGTVTVEIVGDLLDDPTARLDGVRRQSTWSDVDSGVIATSARLLAVGGWPHTWAARSSGRIYDGWAPTVWITEATDDPAYLDAIAAVAATPGAGSAIVVVGADPGCGLRVHLHADGTFHIPDLDLHGQAQTLAAEVVDQLVELLDDADAPVNTDTIVPFPMLPEPSIEKEDVSSEAPPVSEDPAYGGVEDYEDPSCDVVVRLCGPIRVDAGDADLPQRETAIAAYVALNGRADLDQIRDAVWAGAGVSRKRVQNVISTLRGVVGDAVTLSDQQLVAGPGLITDVELIRRRMAHAQRLNSTEHKVELLRVALEWVTGQVCRYPHGGRRCWTWIVLDNWIPHVESLVGKLASQLARLYLELGDGEGACWAANQGIEAIGRRDELVILLVKGYELAGDEASARSAIRSHERYLDELGIDELNDDLLDLLDRYAAPARHKETG